MDIFLGIVVGLIVLILLVTAHEFGHFIAARRNGVKVLEFGICLPPRAIAWVKENGKWRRLKKSEWDEPAQGLVFSLNWLPIGGFCQMDGESAEDSKKGTFGNASLLKKTKILFAGVGMNWLAAFLILTVLAWTGMPTMLDGQFTIAADTRTDPVTVTIAEVKDNSPAAAAGLAAGDIITKIDNTDIVSASAVTEYNNSHADKDVTITVKRGEDIVELPVKLNPEDAEYRLGILMASTDSYSYSTWSAPIVGAGLTLQLTGETFRGLGEMLWHLISGIFSQFSPDSTIRKSGQEAIESVGNSVTGPVGIIGTIFPNSVAGGPTTIAFLTALISVSLACMNVLPIPALDGGRWFLITLYKLRKKRLTKEVEQKIISRAFIALIALIVIVTILDIKRFF